MPKTKKIDVLTVKLTVHIPVDPGKPDTVVKAGVAAVLLSAKAGDLGEATMKARVARVPAPKPAPEASEPVGEPEDPGVSTTEPAGDDLEPPENLRRTAAPESAAAE